MEWKLLKLATLLSLLLAETAFARLLVKHSQTADVPACGSNYTTLWTGFSLMGTYTDGGMRSKQDLGSSGSCVTEFMPLQSIECTAGYCDLGTGGDQSMWLVTERYVDEGGFSMDGLGGTPTADQTTSINNAKARVSRCAVCETPKPIVVRHSYTATVPTCPANWSSLWDGYSFGGATRGSNIENWEDLSDTGSCLPKFVPYPAFSCWDAYCDYDNYDAMWMINNGTQSDLSVKSNAASTNPPLLPAARNIGRVSRCNVCIKN